MAKKALITGIAGFAGSHLTEYLLSQDFQVFGLFHPGHSTQNIDHLKKQISLLSCDILDRLKIKKAVRAIGPDYVFHLAAFSSPAASFADPGQTLQNNIVGQLNILEALAAANSKAKILVVGSADEYGSVEEKYLPIKEETSLNPITPYAVSKVAQDLLGLQFFLHQRLFIVRVRPFNHIGPRQSEAFVVPAFASQIIRLQLKGGGVLKVGNLDNIREFTDVRDMARAYLVALRSAQPGEVYNIGTGKPIKIADVLKIMLSFSKVKIRVEEDRSRIPKIDIRWIYSDPTKFKKQTGWQPQIPLEKTLFDTIEYEQSRIRKS